MFGKKRRSELDFIKRNAQGEYIYTGGYYEYSGDRPRKRVMALLWISNVCGLAAAVGAGVLPVPGMSGHWYVIIPYTAVLILAMSALWSLGQLTLAGDPIREYVFGTACKRLPMRELMTAGVGALTFVGEGAYLLIHGGNVTESVIYMALMLCGAALFFLGWRTASAMSWDRQHSTE